MDHSVLRLQPQHLPQHRRDVCCNSHHAGVAGMYAIWSEGCVVGADDGGAVDEVDVGIAVGLALHDDLMFCFTERSHSDAPRIGRGVGKGAVATEDAHNQNRRGWMTRPGRAR